MALSGSGGGRRPSKQGSSLGEKEHRDTELEDPGHDLRFDVFLGIPSSTARSLVSYIYKEINI